MAESPPRRKISMAERLRAVAEGRTDLWAPPAPRRAATVALLRDGGDGLEVYLIRRAAAMNFPAVTAYPGGGVDPADGEPEAPETLMRAAVREVAEETGVDLTETPLVQFARWITPEPLPVRFDTQFFAAALPSGQEPELRGTEADHAAWHNPQSLLAHRAETGEQLLPPTLATMYQIAAHSSVADALTGLATLPVTPLLPAPRLRAGKLRWELIDAAQNLEITDLEAVGIPSGWRLELEGMRG